MNYFIYSVLHSSLTIVILLVISSSIWMIRDGWYTGDEYFMTFSFAGNNNSFWPFVPKAFSLVFLYYILAKYFFGGEAHATRYIPFIIAIVMYAIVTFGYFKAHKNKRMLYLILFSAGFLLSTVPHYLVMLVNGISMNQAPVRNSTHSSTTNKRTECDYDKEISQQREAYNDQQAQTNSLQEEINAQSMGYHSSQEAKQDGINL